MKTKTLILLALIIALFIAGFVAGYVEMKEYNQHNWTVKKSVILHALYCGLGCSFGPLLLPAMVCVIKAISDGFWVCQLETEDQEFFGKNFA